MKLMKMKIISFLILLLSIAVAFAACDQDKSARAAGAPPSTSRPAQAPVTPLPKLSLPPDSGPPPAIDSARTMQSVNDIVAFGPRPIGSPNHKKVEDYILAHLKGDDVESDIFTIDTSEGKFPVHNIV